MIQRRELATKLAARVVAALRAQEHLQLEVDEGGAARRALLAENCSRCVLEFDGERGLHGAGGATAPTF